MKTIVSIAFLYLLVSGLSAQELPNREHIIVSGHGYVEHMPDYAEIHLTISKTSETLKTSKDFVDKRTKLVLRYATDLGIEPEDISASKILAYPKYEWRRDEHKYLGQMVSRSITLYLRNLNQYPDLIQVLIDAGVTEIDGIQLRFRDQDAIQSEAMEVAIMNAKNKAKTIASQFGASIGKVLKVSEFAIDDADFYQDRQYAMSADVARPESPSLKIRKQRVNETVFVIFTLEQ